MELITVWLRAQLQQLKDEERTWIFLAAQGSAKGLNITEVEGQRDVQRDLRVNS